MVTRTNITEFFEKYNKNLEQEEMLNEALYKTTDQEAWMECLREKARELRACVGFLHACDRERRI